MLTEERYQVILDYLSKHDAVTVTQLTGLLNSSESTIRRDLNVLNEEGKLRKVFGGATSIQQKIVNVGDEKVSSREMVMRREKERIGKYAATLINDHDFIYIDSGTTTACLVDHITNRNATYVTNGVSHALKLLRKGLNAYLVGGKIKPVTEAIVGAEGIRSLEGYNFTKAFMGTNGIDIQAGFTTPDVEEGRMKERAVGQSYTAYVLADHTKFRRVYPVTFSPLDTCCIITDHIPKGDFSEITVIKEVSE